ncbi:MAG: response regulator [Bryobacteraceae bacterium]
MGQTRTVLIVDDDPQIPRLMERMLGGRNVKVLLAPRPSVALEICQRQAIDLLISDVAMPEMDGVRLAGRVLKLHPNAQILLISGEVKDPPVLPKSRHVRFLRKPFFPAQLIECLHELLPEA